jgi:hypothetical protein
MRTIQELEVKEALKRMKGGKALGLGNVALVWLSSYSTTFFA